MLYYSFIKNDLTLRKRDYAHSHARLLSRRVGYSKAGCPPFETHRYAMLLRVRFVV
jgi:hypothetical protein